MCLFVSFECDHWRIVSSRGNGVANIFKVLAYLFYYTYIAAIVKHHVRPFCFFHSVFSVTGALARWRGGAVARWRGGAVARWRGGAVARWRGGAVARWRGGAVARWRSG